MSFKIKLDQAQFANDVRRMMKLTNKEMGSILEEQAGLFVRDAMRFTPPFNNAPMTEALGVQKKSGEAAIMKDLLGGGPSDIKSSNPKAGIFIVIPQNMVKVSETRKRSGNVKLFATKSGQVYGVDAEHWKVDAPLSELVAHHEKYRSKTTGRVTSAGARTRDVGRWRFIDKFIIRQAQFTKLSKMLFAKVGLGKSGWVKAMRELRNVKRELPGWITRHAKGTASGIFAKTGTGNKVSFTVGNAVPHVQRFAQHVENRAWKNRIRNFTKQVDKTAQALARKASRA